jgi:DNA-binding CsgD family transcriptional regulator
MARPARPEALTERQREVADLVARGLTNAQIAERLGISLDGAKWHVSEVIGRLGVTTREEAALAWRMERRPARRLLAIASTPRVLWLLAGAGCIAVVTFVALVLWLAGVNGDDGAPEDVAMLPSPPLPAFLANPATPILVYVDSSQLEYPFDAEIVIYDLAARAELSRTRLDGVNDVARAGDSVVALDHSGLRQYDLAGSLVRTIYHGDLLSWWDLDEDSGRAVITGDHGVVMVDMADGTVLAEVASATIPGWAAGAIFYEPSWIEGQDAAVVQLSRQRAASPGYAVVTSGGGVEFFDREGGVTPSQDGHLLFGEPIQRCALRDGGPVIDAVTGSEVARLSPVDGYRTEVFWTSESTLVSEVASEVEDADGSCRIVPREAELAYEEFDPLTGAVTLIDDWPARVGAYYERWIGGALLPRCEGMQGHPFAVPPTWCSPFGVAFFYRDVPVVGAINPRLFLGVYEP